MTAQRILAGTGALALAVALAACGSVATAAKPAATVTHTVTARPAPAKTHSAKPKPVHAAAPTQAALPTVPTNSAVDPAARAVEPSAIDTSADGNGALTGITWSSWTANNAEGSGSISIDNGVPNMAQGAVVNVPVSIALSAPANGSFTAMTVTDHAGNTNTYSFNGGSGTYGLSNADKAPASAPTQSSGLPATGVWYPAGFPDLACGPPTPGTNGLNTSYIQAAQTGQGGTGYVIDTDDPASSPCNS